MEVHVYVVSGNRRLYDHDEHAVAQPQSPTTLIYTALAIWAACGVYLASKIATMAWALGVAKYPWDCWFLC